MAHSLALSLALAAATLLIEAAAGYPAPLFRRIGHPVTWIGAMLARLDAALNREGDPAGRRRAAGFLALLVLLAASGGAALALTLSARAALPPLAATLLLAICASACLAQHSLDEHVRAVAEALQRDGVAAGRRAVAMIVGRDTADMDEAAVARAAIESLAENFSDGVVAPLFWLVLGGLPGTVLLKAVNTADSMIGHRTPRHEAFGFASAKLDDAANWIPARLSVLLLAGAAALVPGASAGEALRITRRDASGHPSPNAGWPEAAMAGALGVRLGGPRSYGGKAVADRAMGDGPAALDATSIRQALRLYRTACAIEIATVTLAAGIAAV